MWHFSIYDKCLDQGDWHISTTLDLLFGFCFVCLFDIENNQNLLYWFAV